MSVFQRRPQIFKAASTSSHTASSISGAGSSNGRDSRTGSNIRSQDSGWDSGWDSEARKSDSQNSKSVRWNLHSARKRSASLTPAPTTEPTYVTIGDEFQNAVERLLRINSQAFAITGTVPLMGPVCVYFQTPTDSCHMLRFPNDVVSPSRTFDTLMASCEPGSAPPSRTSKPDPNFRSYLTYRTSSSRPISTTFELSQHPILDTVKRTLFPSAPEGHYLTGSLNRVDIYPPGSSSSQPRSHVEPGSEEEPVAHIIITLPVRFRGGQMVVSKDGNQETFWGRGCLSSASSTPPIVDKRGGIGSIEWVAFLAGDCDQRVERVEKGARVNLVYDVFMKSYGPFGPSPRPLIVPNDGLLTALSSVLKRSRGSRLAFYLTNDYGIAPSHVLAESLIPSLKGSDSALYHALRLYNLKPCLRYVAGGYIWPVNSPATIVASPTFLEAIKRLALKSAGADEDLCVQIEDGGGVPLERENIVLATGQEQGRIGRERVAFLEARDGQLDYLHINVCMVVYVH
ncbi:hypothetical protein FRC02_008318 [Tulasnella sp. 418]|nr:hypothetical protein FRC02_008318 [Tulasnella sp. 418]